MRPASLSPFLIAAAASLGALGACSPYSPDLGDTPFLCGSGEPQCPDGYTCMAGSGGGPSYCATHGGMLPADASMGGGDGGGGPDCSADQNLEPNDTIQQAFSTGVEDQRSTLQLAGLAICPGTDKDTYSAVLTGTHNLEVTVTYGTPETPGPALQASIVSSVGTPLASATPMGNGTIHAWAANLPAGAYYVQVQAGTVGGDTTNTYKLTVTACATPGSGSSCTP
jgi:hypothetical protein